MKITMDRDALAPVLAKAAKIANGRIIPILGCVLLTASKDGVKINATDMDRWHEFEMGAEVAKYGTAVVDAAKLAGVVAALPAGSQVELQAASNLLTLRNGRATFRFACLDVRDFPAFPKIKKTTEVAVAGDELARVIGFTGAAVSADPSRYYLCGVCLENTQGEITATATDGKLLHSTKVATDKAEPFATIIIPGHALPLLAAMAETSEAVTLLIGDGALEARVDGHRIASKLIDNTFPDWRRIVPVDTETSIEVDPASFRDAIQRVIPVAGDGDRGGGRVISLRPQIGEVLIAGAQGATSAAVDSIDATIKGQPGDLTFQSRCLIDAIDGNSGETFKMQVCEAAIRIDGANGDLIVVARYSQPYPDVGLISARGAAATDKAA